MMHERWTSFIVALVVACVCRYQNFDKVIADLDEIFRRVKGGKPLPSHDGDSKASSAGSGGAGLDVSDENTAKGLVAKNKELLSRLQASEVRVACALVL